jgi:hypothetical protein
MTSDDFVLLNEFSRSAESGDGVRFANHFSEGAIYYDYIYGAQGRANIAHMMQNLFQRNAADYRWEMFDPVFDGTTGYAWSLVQRRERAKQSRGAARFRPAGFDAAAFATRGLAEPKLAKPAKAGGARRDRTADLVIANDALSQLSYGPFTTGSTETPGSRRCHLQSPLTASQERRKSRFTGPFWPQVPLFAGERTDI